MSVYVTDTHPLIWYAAGKHANLSKKVQRAFQEATSDRALIFVPAVVFWEIALLNKLGRVTIREPFERWAAALLAKSGFDVIELDPAVIAGAMDFDFNKDPFDAVIVACAAARDLPLITKDVAITEARVVEVMW